MKQKYFHDRKCAPLPHVEEREIIRIQNPENRQWEPAVVQKDLRNRSYNVLNQQGNTVRRNRNQILKSNEQRFRVSKPDIKTYDPPEMEPSDYIPYVSENVKSGNVSGNISARTNRENSIPHGNVIRSGRVTKPPTYLSEYVK